MSVLLEVKGLSSGYGKVPVLHGIEFQVAEKEVLGVLGNNGMGKSTLLKTLMGILSASAGTVLYSGQDVTRNKPGLRAQYGMGYVPQGRGIFSNLSVLDNLRMGVVGHGLDEEDAVRNIVLDFPTGRSFGSIWWYSVGWRTTNTCIGTLPYINARSYSSR